MVRLAAWTRRAGRATLGAIWLASLEARTRVEAIVSGCEGRDAVEQETVDACDKGRKQEKDF